MAMVGYSQGILEPHSSLWVDRYPCAMSAPASSLPYLGFFMDLRFSQQLLPFICQGISWARSPSAWDLGSWRVHHGVGR